MDKPIVWLIVRPVRFNSIGATCNYPEGVFVGEDALDRAKAMVWKRELERRQFAKRHNNTLPFEATDAWINRPLQWHENEDGHWELTPDDLHPYMPIVHIQEWDEGEYFGL